jgi:hypothetical protein
MLSQSQTDDEWRKKDGKVAVVLRRTGRIHGSTYRTRYVRRRSHIFVPICNTFFHPRHKTHRDKLPDELGGLFDVLLAHAKQVHFWS